MKIRIIIDGNASTFTPITLELLVFNFLSDFNITEEDVSVGLELFSYIELFGSHLRCHLRYCYHEAIHYKNTLK